MPVPPVAMNEAIRDEACHCLVSGRLGKAAPFTPPLRAEDHNSIGDSHSQDMIVGKGQLLVDNMVQTPSHIPPPRSILKTPDTSRDSSCNSSKSVNRSVSFESITVRNYSMGMGDHPCCSIGAPVSLSWDFDEEDPKDIDVYESERRPRRPLKFLVLNYYRRRDILLKLGYTEGDMKEAAKSAAKVQRNRGTTGFLGPVCKIEEAFQSAGRKMKRVVRRKRTEDV